jgi:hypothetical protein
MWSPCNKACTYEWVVTVNTIIIANTHQEHKATAIYLSLTPLTTQLHDATPLVLDISQGTSTGFKRRSDYLIIARDLSIHSNDQCYAADKKKTMHSLRSPAGSDHTKLC